MLRYASFFIVAAWPTAVLADGDFENRAAPPTAAGTTDLAVDVRPGLEVFAQYAYRRTEHANDGSGWYHELDVPRIHVALDASIDSARGRVVIEGVRSASEGALIGVAGNSMVFRAREAFAAYTLGIVEGSAGIVPKLTLPELDGTWMLRAVAMAPSESQGVYAPADVGATVRATLPRGYGFIGIGGYNGEGYQHRELNRGKNGEVAASIHPAPGGVLGPLAVFASYELGSTGTGLARADRASFALLWQGKLLRAGAAATHAWGLADDGSRRALLFDVFVRAEPVTDLLLGVRAGHFVRDATSTGDTVTTVDAAVGYRLARPLEVFLAGTRSQPSSRAEESVPGSRYWEARLVSRVVF
ncbi:MAG: hypothetical protein IT377_10625 [Polyangiaceae bacterium]|nr:hypothetical protein [Polyangiaceae bacterium]